jgi:hypothetical protein
LPKSLALTCAQCGTGFRRFPSRALRYPQHFCSRECYTAHQKANRVGCIHPGTGYRQISIECRTVLEHRLVMERHLGRSLGPEEVVHHINGDRADNRIENLRVIKDSATHMREHGLERWDTAEAVRLRDAGHTYKDIGKILGSSASTVYKRLRDNGLTVPFARKGVKRNRSVL